MKKNAREHNINKGMQKLTALRLGQHIDNAESLKKKKNEIKNVEDCHKNELNKIKKSKRFISRSRFFNINMKFQPPNQWFRAGTYLGGGGTSCHVRPLLTLPFDDEEQS